MEQGMPEAVNIMAEVAAGGDRAKMEKMMEMGELDAVKYLPLFFEALGKRAKPYIEEYYKTVQFARNKAARANEEYMKKFLEGGAAEGMNAVLKAYAQVTKASSRFAGTIGKYFKVAGLAVSAVMIGVQELGEWFSGKAEKGNFMTYLFGESSESEVLSSFTGMIESLKSLILSWEEASRKSVGNIVQVFDELGATIVFILDRMRDLFSIVEGYSVRGIAGGGHAIREAIARESLKGQVDREADEEGEDTGMHVPRSVRLKRLEAYMEQWRKENPQPKFEGALSFLSMPFAGPVANALNPISGVGTVLNLGKKYSGGIFSEDEPAESEASTEPVAGNAQARRRRNRISRMEAKLPGELTPIDLTIPPSAISDTTTVTRITPLDPQLGLKRDRSLEKQVFGELNFPITGRAPNNIPANTPNSAQGIQFRHYMEVKFTGDVSVNGSVETLTADLDFEEPFKALFIKELNSQLPQTNLLAK